MAKKIPADKGPTPEKAATMLDEGVANGKPISPRQKRFFAARAYGTPRNSKRGRRPRR